MNNHSQHSARILPKKLIAFTLDSLDSLAHLFISLKFTPNFLSLFALLLGIAAGLLFFLSQPVWAGVVILFCGLFDILDGKVAVKSNRRSLFGAIFDSTLDRYSEFFIYLGLAAYFRNHWALWLSFLAFLGSSMVSYTRARAEGLGMECKVGVMQRAERMLLLALGAIVGSAFKAFDPAMIGVLAVIAVVSNFTAFQRILFVKKIEKTKKSESQSQSN